VIQDAAAQRAPLRGITRIIVVLVEFSDKALAFPRQHYEDLFFSAGVLQNGSVKEYFQEVTNGLVEIAGEVVGPYRMPKTLKEYAHSASGTGQIPPNARTMARDAAEAANPQVDFSLYDNDGDNYVDAFIVLHAGPGAEVTGSVDDIWSHKWVLPGGDFNADGTRIYAYLTVPEDAKIGVCCHELGHLLFGFPDLYDTDYSSEGVGNWCLMGGGSWLGGGEVPAHLSAWCKLHQGWVTAETPTNAENFQIPDVKDSLKVYKLWQNGQPGKEYFLLENRQKMGFDRFLPGSGLLIWHIDDAIPSNSNENQPKVALVQSDGDTDLEFGNNRGDSGDPFPGSSNNRVFDDTSTPNSHAYSHSDSFVRVRNISDSGTVMTADIFCLDVEKPKLTWWQKFMQWLKNLFR
jgi:immune inhibitor A